MSELGGWPIALAGKVAGSLPIGECRSASERGGSSGLFPERRRKRCQHLVGSDLIGAGFQVWNTAVGEPCVRRELVVLVPPDTDDELRGPAGAVEEVMQDQRPPETGSSPRWRKPSQHPVNPLRERRVVNGGVGCEGLCASLDPAADAGERRQVNERRKHRRCERRPKSPRGRQAATHVFVSTTTAEARH